VNDWILVRHGLASLGLVVASMLATENPTRAQEQPGSIRGVVSDADFSVPLGGVTVTAVEVGLRAITTDDGHYVLPQVPPGTHTLVFTKEDYERQVVANVRVTSLQLTDVDVELAGEFTDMDELVVQDILQIDAGSELGLIQLRFESPALMDSISADLMRMAGASDAAAGLTLVAGATVQDGKSAVIRGLPDRYVSSQMNGVRLPTADEDKRAVELDQFPTPVIESLQVTKTFTPDQDGDASGGAVNVKLKGIPSERLFELKGQISYNNQVGDRDDFLSYEGGGVSGLGIEDDRDVQPENTDWSGTVATDEEQAPIDYKFSAAWGNRYELDNGVKLGAFASLFYERDSAYSTGEDNSYWVETANGPLIPQTTGDNFNTALFDVTQGTQSVQWGGLTALGLETDHNKLGLTYLYTRTAEDKATLAIDTRGKEFFFPGYDPDNPIGTGNQPGELNLSPYIRNETLEYTERTTQSLQLDGRHELPFLGGQSWLKQPEVEWVAARSKATLDQPDKRLFGAYWLPRSFNPGAPPFVPPFFTDPTWFGYKPADAFTLGNVQRIFKSITEDSTQLAADVKFPFEQWGGELGYFKAGLYSNLVDREFRQDTFSNFNDNSTFGGEFDEPWSDVFEDEIGHNISGALVDVDYDGELDVNAAYGMVDLPLSSKVKAVGGARFETTDLSIVNFAEDDAQWFPPGSPVGVDLGPGDADVSFEQEDLLPALGLEYRPVDGLTLRASYSQTVARQTFKEVTPVKQQEYLGGPVFIGNPDLGMSSLDNYDLRLDYAPYPGGLVSVSWFHKNVEDSIEYVQRFAGFTFTTARNYPDGELSGYELELRQDMGRFAEKLSGLSLGANATFIDSTVTLPADEQLAFDDPAINVPTHERDMTNAPEYLYNLYLTYDFDESKTQFAVFYTVEGDTLVAGATATNGNFVPDVYAKAFGTLNMSLTRRLGRNFSLNLQAKNLTNPDIEEVYRSDAIGDDVTKTTYKKGSEFSLGLGVHL